MCQELQILAYEYKLSLFTLCDSGFGITPVVDIAIWITCAAFCFHIAHISFASSWYLFLFVGYCFGEIIIIIIIITDVKNEFGYTCPICWR
jgi:hypothetical protein